MLWQNYGIWQIRNFMQETGGEMGVGYGEIGEGGMGRWGDGEMGNKGATRVVGIRGNGEMGRWGDKERIDL